MNNKKSELEKSIDATVKEADTREKERIDALIQIEITEKIDRYFSSSLIKPTCFIAQAFWCKHDFHKYFSFYDTKWCGSDRYKVGYVIICLKCGEVQVYADGWRHVGFVDPNQPLPTRCSAEVSF